MSDNTEGDFFIIMNSQDGNKIMAISDESNDIALFKTKGDASACAENHCYCKAFGYEIFERGMGLS